MIKSAFSSVAHRMLSFPIGIVAVPRTALPSLLVRIRWMVAILTPPFVGVIDPEQCPCERADLSEADQQAFVNLALRGNVHPAEQEH